MFNFTYKEMSKYIRKKDIDTVLSFSYSGFFKKLGVFILMLGFIIAIYAIGIGPAQGDYGNSGNRIASIMGNMTGPIVKILDLGLFLIVFLWVVIPQYNRGMASVHGALIGFIWILVTFFAMEPLTTILLVAVQGWISYFIQLFIMFVYFCVSAYYWFMKIHAKKLKINNINIITTTIILTLFINIVMIIYAIAIRHIKLEFAVFSTMYMLYIPIIAMLFYQLDRFFKVIYIQKYNEKFRVAYKIPDKEWWFTAEAATKHPRVYPPAKDGASGVAPKEGDNNE
ncbi:beta-carotene 15,15'-monooxygenase [Limosilactobacillus gorillae]|uniref:beta-carotene 15,15'-monooxygenase n=1 Tax=Limosilactobacillus gorillae TaxID=1450649 RepID=UPI000AE7AFFD|nr:beta-carotene 15,15'-monooxygenase [Limosilactobacillus gorillae]